MPDQRRTGRCWPSAVYELKLLLDESAPRRLVSYFSDSFEVRTVPQLGWAGCTNGDLLHLAAAGGFDALVTVDQDSSINRT